jgi:hypothetical protein
MVDGLVDGVGGYARPAGTARSSRRRHVWPGPAAQGWAGHGKAKRRSAQVSAAQGGAAVPHVAGLGCNAGSVCGAGGGRDGAARARESEPARANREGEPATAGPDRGD